MVKFLTKEFDCISRDLAGGCGTVYHCSTHTWVEVEVSGEICLWAVAFSIMP
jgi:hypothetical protein